MQFREIPYLWRRDKPECVGDGVNHLVIYLLQCIHCLRCFSAGSVGGNLPGCHPAGTGYWSGGGLGCGAAHCRLQDSVVIIPFMTTVIVVLILALGMSTRYYRYTIYFFAR